MYPNWEMLWKKSILTQIGVITGLITPEKDANLFQEEETPPKGIPYSTLWILSEIVAANEGSKVGEKGDLWDQIQNEDKFSCLHSLFHSVCDGEKIPLWLAKQLIGKKPKSGLIVKNHEDDENWELVLVLPPDLPNIDPEHEIDIDSFSNASWLFVYRDMIDWGD